MSDYINPKTGLPRERTREFNGAFGSCKYRPPESLETNPIRSLKFMSRARRERAGWGRLAPNRGRGVTFSKLSQSN